MNFWQPTSDNFAKMNNKWPCSDRMTCRHGMSRMCLSMGKKILCQLRTQMFRKHFINSWSPSPNNISRQFFSMKSTLALTVVLFVCTQEVFGCGSYKQYGSWSMATFRSPKNKTDLGCATTQRMRQICTGNPNNDYRKEDKIPLRFSRTLRNDNHNSLDIKCAPGSSVYAPFRGKITYRDDNSLVMIGLKTFKGDTIKMNNFHVSSSLSVNMSVLARQYIGNMTDIRLHGDLEGTTRYIHIELSGSDANYTAHLSWFVCPAIKWSDNSQRFYSHTSFNNAWVHVDHDKFNEEVGETIDQEEGSADEEEGSGESVPKKVRPKCRGK